MHGLGLVGDEFLCESEESNTRGMAPGVPGRILKCNEEGLQNIWSICIILFYGGLINSTVVNMEYKT